MSRRNIAIRFDGHPFDTGFPVEKILVGYEQAGYAAPTAFRGLEPLWPNFRTLRPAGSGEALRHGEGAAPDPASVRQRRSVYREKDEELCRSAEFGAMLHDRAQSAVERHVGDLRQSLKARLSWLEPVAGYSHKRSGRSPGGSTITKRSIDIQRSGCARQDSSPAFKPTSRAVRRNRVALQPLLIHTARRIGDLIRVLPVPRIPLSETGDAIRSHCREPAAETCH